MKKIIAGVDEVGRGSLVGPVYAGAVILNKKINTKLLKDSKLLSKQNREKLNIYIKKNSSWSIGKASVKEIEKFKKKYKNIIRKPTHGYGGKNIFFINKSTSKKQISKYLKKHDHVMAQKFLPQIKLGDKRIFIIGGIIKGAIRRIPMKGSIVSNIGQGGKAVKTILTKRELHIAKIVASDLKKNQIVFAGIDLISNYLTGDINITSPTGLKNFKDLTGIDLAVDIWNYLEKN